MLLGRNSVKGNPLLWFVVAFVLTALFVSLLSHGPTLEASKELLNKHIYGTTATKSEASREHPIKQLSGLAFERFEALIKRQSKTYEAAVLAYHSRYNRLPPPGFRKWFEHAKANDCPIIDDFDVMERDLAPFRKMSGKNYYDIAKDLPEAPWGGWKCGIYNGEMKDCPGELAENLGNITKDIPDVHMPMNVGDEPRVLALPGEHNDPYWEVGTHLNLWANVTQPCSNSALGSEKTGTVETYHIPFIQNPLHELNVCNHDSTWSELHGFWSASTLKSYTNNMIPVLSPAAPSTFRDIMFPAVAYMLGMYSWDEKEAVPWEEKEPGLYWAGSTTGTHIANLSTHWESAHRERFVLFANQHDKEKQYTYLHRNEASQLWEPEMSFHFNKDVYHAYFTNIVQCGDGGCEAIKEMFKDYITGGRPREENSKYTLVFDTDGNGHSGRYYRLLTSHSLPLKQTVFREWHDDRLIPWVHFVPVTLGMEELPETVRYLVEEEEGRELARVLAEKGRDWAMKSLRPVDQASYFYRLALEMAALQDQGRLAAD